MRKWAMQFEDAQQQGNELVIIFSAFLFLLLAGGHASWVGGAGGRAVRPGGRGGRGGERAGVVAGQVGGGGWGRWAGG